MVSPWRSVLMLATKLAPVPGPAACQVCRHASRGSYGWMSKNDSDSHLKQKQQGAVFEDDHDMDAVEVKLDSIISEEKRRHKAAKFHMIKRKMNSPGAPQRKLSWDAIEQIRYLKQESPEEWTLQRLAEGFSVSPDVISRVLRSTFTPPEARKLKQDAKVSPSSGQQYLRDGKTEQSRLQKSLAPSALLSSANSSDSALETLDTNRTGLVPSAGHITLSKPTAVLKVAPEYRDRLESEGGMDVNDDVEFEDEWDGVILTDEELEKITQTLHDKPSPVEQRGRDFFDSEGNFLYRV
ncbi:neugrin [Danio aesculapii]|uniref:neugrin n=1 Tax=Danio aesculapii TaxID=1142201 RepID=UPI0024C08069|nr:neugrin [Danio aesculapii]